MSFPISFQISTKQSSCDNFRRIYVVHDFIRRPNRRRRGFGTHHIWPLVGAQRTGPPHDGARDHPFPCAAVRPSGLIDLTTLAAIAIATGTAGAITAALYVSESERRSRQRAASMRRRVEQYDATPR
ncbi:MAG: hypothetical protein IPJ94_09795 [Chloroflexi bacterium]|nr:hypothetical protein [Chloroflexota bacterium]